MDLDPELAFVGAVLHLPEKAVADALSVIADDDLANPHLRVVLWAARILVAEEVTPDPYAVVTVVRGAGVTISADHAATLARTVIEAHEACPVPASWRFYAAGVLDQTMRRRSRELSERIAQASGGPLDTLLELVGTEAAAVAELGRRRAAIGTAGSTRLRVVSA